MRRAAQARSRPSAADRRVDATTRRIFVVVLVAIVAVTGAAALLLGGGGGVPAPSTSAPTSGSSSGGVIPASPITGVIVAVDSRGLDDVRGISLRTDEGTILIFDLREMRDTATFPLGHLAEHQATAESVRVSFRVEDGVLVATAIDDA